MEQFERKFIVNSDGEAQVESVNPPIRPEIKKHKQIIRLEEEKRKFVANSDGEVKIEK